MTETTTTRPKFVVCPECDGEGKFGPGFVWTQDDIDVDPEGFEDTQRLLREGYFDTACEFCKGNRVVTPERADEHADFAAYQAEVAAEARYFGYDR